VYVIDGDRNARLWRSTLTRRGAERAAWQFTVMPIGLLPLDPILVRSDEREAFGRAYRIREVDA
jgi:hypothetical protein